MATKKSRTGRGAKGDPLPDEILRELGTSRILSTSELAKAIGEEARHVRQVCHQLQEKGVIRFSRRPRDRPLYRFVLTGDTLHSGNIDLIRELRERVNEIIKETQSEQLLPEILDTLEELRSEYTSEPEQQLLDRSHNALSSALAEGKEADELRELLNLEAFWPVILYWWPQELEKLSEAPVRRVVRQIDRNKLHGLETRLRTDYKKMRTQIEEAPLGRSDLLERPVLTARGDSEKLVQALRSWSADTLLVEHREVISKTVARETLPDIDGGLLGEVDIRRWLAVARSVEGGTDQLTTIAIDSTTIRITLERLSEPVDEGEASERDNQDRKPSRAKLWALRWTDLLLNGTLAFTNLGVALGYGLSGNLTSLAGTDIGVGMAVQTSVFSALQNFNKVKREIERAVEDRF